MRNLIKIAICFMVLITSQLYAGTIYYINGTNGNDNNNGLTLSTAWKTFNKANSTLVASDTVYIRGGTYTGPSNYIAPSKSGTAGNYITYARYQSEVVTIDGPACGADLKGKSYIKIDGLRIINCFYIDMYSTSTTEHNIIQNCYFAYPDNNGFNWAGIWMGYDASPWGNCNYNQILNNEFHAGSNGCPDDLIYLQPYSKYNLIQGNTFYSSSHNCIDLQAIQIQDGVMYNVIKDNYIINQYHTGLNIYAGSQRNLVEGNTIEDCNTTWYQSGIQIGGTKNIIRRNVLINNGTGILLEEDNTNGISSDYSRIYHNTFNKNKRGVYTTTAEGLTEATVKNNIFYNDVDYEISWDVQGNPRDNYFITNNISGAAIKFYPPGDQTLSYFQGNYPSYWRGNVQFNPQFANEANRDLHLQPTSPAIDAGAFLTKTKTSGSGTSIPVEDAQYFMNGWGIIEGDLIQLEGQTQTARITNVDYNNNILAVDTSLTWSSGQGISLRYLGFAPDIGTYEYDGGFSPLIASALASPTSGQSPLAVTFTGSATGGSTPYTYSWNFGDGQTSTTQNSSHTYFSSGNYTAALTVTDSKGAMDVKSVTINVTSPPPTLVATASANPTSGQAPLAVTFTGSATGGSTPYSYSWSFGDGQSSTSQNPSHTFSSAGNYTATLTVTDSQAKTDSKSVSITATSAPPPLVATASANPTSGQAPLAVTFTGSATGGSTPYSYSWSFGDGQSSTVQNPAHIYTTIGNFTATLTVTDSKSSTASASINITVNTQSTYTLSISSATGAPATGQGGTTDPSPGNHSFSSGSTVQVKSIPNTDYRFSKWAGDISATDIFRIDPTIAVDKNKTVSANFCTKCGDVNGDLNLTPSDAQRTFDIYLGRIANPTDCEKENADVNSSGTKLDPKITPADAQAIFNKYLRKGELPSDCSGNSRAAALILEKLSLPNLHLIINDVTIVPGEEVIVPVIVESPNGISAFGFDLIFPSDTLEFIGLENTELTKGFDQLAANVLSYNLLRVGGFKTQLTQNPSNGVLVTLIFRVIGEAKESSSISIISTYDDIENASIKNGTIYTKNRENESLGKRIEGKRFVR